jgi:ATP-dependent Clp endopeptidase proteolytic subunit ClpP
MAWAIKAQNEAEAEILLYDIIGGYDDDWVRQSAKNFINKLKELGDVKNISLRINSAGGIVFEAQAIYNYLRIHRAYKTVRIDGLAASAASLVAMAGDKIIMPSNALMMIHNPQSIARGEASEMRKEAEVLDKVRDAIAAVYVAKTGLDYDKIVSMMDEETWMTADEAKSLGFCDETGEAIEIAACAQNLTEGDIVWKTTTGGAQFSRALGAKMPEAAKRVPLTLLSEAIAAPKIVASAFMPQNKSSEEELDIKNVMDLENNFPQLVKEIRDAAFVNGTKAERERLKALDGLKGPGREEIVARAKYVDPKEARDIAMELLQASNNLAALEARQADASAVNDLLIPFSAPSTSEAVANRIADEINAIRGYKK